MTRQTSPVRRSRVPAGRIERLARFGWLAGEVALGAVAEGVRRVAGSSAAHSLMLTEANAQRLARRLSGLRGAAMKVGQMLSLQGADILPPEVTRALAILRAEADAMPQAQLRRVLGQVLARVRDLGLELAFRTGGFRLPPADAVFLNRKLVGTFLLCARLRARVDVRQLLQAALAGRAGAGRPVE